ncbi:MAG: dienelactone hydrolase family protein [Alistipes sp.]|nr:dienelactone hydrolase family protein [Alistipes sp.]
MKKSILTLALAVLLCLPSILIAQQAVEKYIVETEYLLYLPENYDADTTVRWPLVVFLHGAGETGSDIDRIKLHGLPKLIEQGMQFPFVAVSPQAKTYGWDPRLITEIVDQVARKYRLDSDRYYLTGLSMGGFGTWSTAQSFPGFFAAIVPICGGGFPQIAYVLSKTAVWNFHGDADDIVSIDYSNEMIEAVREYNPEARYTVYPGVGHDSWTETYENPEVWQ